MCTAIFNGPGEVRLRATDWVNINIFNKFQP